MQPTKPKENEMEFVILTQQKGESPGIMEVYGFYDCDEELERAVTQLKRFQTPFHIYCPYEKEDEMPDKVPDCAYYAPEDPRWDMQHVDHDVYEIKRILTLMLDVGTDDIPPELLDRCYCINALVRSAKPIGNLRSTQVIATIVDQWLREKEEKV